MSSEQDSQLAVSQPRTVKDYLALPAYKDRFTEVLNKRAPQFMAAITAVSQMPTLKEAEPRSVIAAAMVSATLDLPVNPTLGQSHIVAYKNQQGVSIAQFQIGYKGLIQLALRSGQYKRLNAGPVNAEVFVGYDGVGEPVLDWSKFNPALAVGGYFCAFELVNGFTKIVYWSKAQVDAHGKRFSKAYQKGYQSSPWFSDFDGMATKTVIKNALTKWGMLSVEMQKAVVHDQGAQADVDADVKYVDGEDRTADSIEGDPAPDRPAPKPRSPKGAALVKDNPKPVEIVVENTTTQPDQPATAANPATTTVAAKRGNPLHAEGEKIIAEANAKVAEETKQRTTLNDGEVLKTEAQVEEFKTLDITKDGKVHKSIKAVITSPEYKGEVYHLNGAADPAWTVDAPVRITLGGLKSPKLGRVLVWVQEIGPATEATPETAAGEDV